MLAGNKIEMIQGLTADQRMWHMVAHIAGGPFLLSHTRQEQLRLVRLIYQSLSKIKYTESELWAYIQEREGERGRERKNTLFLLRFAFFYLF